MLERRISKIIRMILFVALACFGFGFAVKALWNVLVPPIFGWHAITFWQAVGLLILSKILFGGFHRSFGGRSGAWKQRMQQRMEQMTPEQREQFRSGMRCGRGPLGRSAEPQV